MNADMPNPHLNATSLVTTSDMSGKGPVSQTESNWLKARALEEIDAAVIIVDTQGDLLFANSRFHHLAGIEPSLSLAGPAFRRNCPEIAQAIDLLHRENLAPENLARDELHFFDRANRPVWVRLSVQKVFGGASGDLRLVATLTDITDARLHDGLYQNILEALIQDRPVPQILSMLCLEVEQLLRGVTMSILRVDEDGCLRHLAAPSLPDSYCRAIDGVPIGPCVGSCGTSAFLGKPVLVKDINTDPLWAEFCHLTAPLGFVSCWSTPIRARDDRVSGTFAFYSRQPLSETPFMAHLIDMCGRLCRLALEKRDDEAKIQYLAHNDVLTGLANRAFFQARLFEEAQRADRQSTSLALHMIDLDRFKEINDGLGHPAGDDILRVVADTLRSVAGDGDVVARLGGDEFVLLQVGIREKGTAEARAQSLIEALDVAIQSQLLGTGIRAGASLGFAVFPQDADDMDLVVRHADMALYQAKSDGKGVWRAFDMSMAQALHNRRTMEGDLREALANPETCLSVAYQPQIRLSDNAVIGFEALARWNHPHLGDISPAQFIPVAEESGLVGPLGRWILESACRDAAAWPLPLGLSVNLSAIQIFEDDLVEFVHELLIRTGLLAARLELEVTESVVIENTDRALYVLRRLKALGVRIAMDDFGTGYSSLSYLQIFPFDKIKIDRSFINAIDQGVQPRAIIRAVIGLAHAIDVPVIAEGVETQAQIDFLHDQGCDEMQGYFVGRPMTQTAMPAWCSAWRDQAAPRDEQRRLRIAHA